MYLGVDIGGTKTLVAALDDQGQIIEEDRFETPRDYSNFLSRIKISLKDFGTKIFRAGAVGAPAVTIDRNKGIASNFGNLPWPKVNISKDIEGLASCPITIENDAKLAGLSEAILLKDKYTRVLFLTISTGIGLAFVNNLEIDTNAGDGGGKTIVLEHAGQIVSWESFASGKAIAERFHKMAKEINSRETWEAICRDIVPGLVELIAIFQPEVVVIGGSVGKYFNKYKQILASELSKYDLPMIKMPALMGAQRADNAVVYGCYELAKKRFING